MPQLDGLRAVAILGVMIWHFWPESLAAVHLPVSLGVELFFVLSGFLITRILLNGDNKVEFFAKFYLRRALRLFPLYYLVLTILLFISGEVRDAWFSYAFYGVNFWVAEHQQWGVATHFWSLAVEEQFYLIWPLIVLTISRRALEIVCITLIGCGVLFRISVVIFTDNLFAAFFLLPGCIDQLACGALLALCGLRNPPYPSKLVRLVAVGAGSAVATIVCWHLIPGRHVLSAMLYSLALPFFFLLVRSAACGHRGPVGRILGDPVLCYLGRISYGIYVIHFVVPWLMGPSIYALQPPVKFVIYSGATIGLAALSWHFYETPINRRRGRFIDALVRWLGVAAPAEAG